MEHPKTNKASRLALVAIAFAFTGFLTSCSDDENVVDPTARIPFIGSYEVKDQNNEEDAYFWFILNVQESEKGADKVDLKNFRYINNGVFATIKENKFVINQTLQDSDEKVVITGEGTLTGEKLVYSYKIVVTKVGKATRTFENTAEATKIE